MRRALVPVASPCHPTQVIGHPLRRPLRSLVPRRERRCPSSSLPGEWFLLSYGPAPSRRSPPRRTRPSLYLFRFLSGISSPSLLPFPPGLWSARSPFLRWCLSLPPDIRIDSSAARSRPPFFLSATFFLRMPRPRTIFISTTCLARRGAARRVGLPSDLAVGSDVHLAPLFVPTLSFSASFAQRMLF